MSKPEPWEHHELSKVWKSKSSFMSYIRGCLRKAWMRHPAKIAVLKANRKKIPNPNPRGKVKEVWGFHCELCNKDYIQSEGQVDHINPAGSLRCKEDLQGFTERLFWVVPEDLRLICKGCNTALSHAEKMGITLEEARADKLAIQKEKEGVESVKEFISSKGVVPESNTKGRRKQLVSIYLEEGV